MPASLFGLFVVFVVLAAVAFGCRSADPRRPFPDNKAAESSRLRFDSGVPAVVAHESVRGEVFFKVYRAPFAERGPRPVDVCVLQHGFGVGQTLLDFRRLTFEAFVSTYFGAGVIRRLLSETCGRVVVTAQESNRTSILEMTQRTEVFLREIACPAGPRLLRCAFVGHSKGGAVAFSMARRCMQQRSLLGKEGCARMREFYSATGVIQGALGAFVAYGAALTRNSEHQKLFVALLGWGMNLVWDVFEEYVPGRTNPIWLDLSPLAPMEDGVPLIVANDIVLERRGWLVGDFAASAVDFRFRDDGSSQLLGCGSVEESSRLNEQSCLAFGRAVGRLHSAELRPSFEAGVRATREKKSAPKQEWSRRFTWEAYQESDGLADLTLAISACRKGLAVPEARRAVRACTVLPALNHLATAGGGPAALSEIIRQLQK